MKFSQYVRASSSKCIKTGLKSELRETGDSEGRKCLLLYHFKRRLAPLLHLPKYVPGQGGPNLLRGKTTLCLYPRVIFFFKYFFFYVMS